MSKINVVCAQINTTVGDFEGNYNKIIDTINTYSNTSYPTVIVFPELTIQGYFPKDLLYKEFFINKSNEMIKNIRDYMSVKCLPNMLVVVGGVNYNNNKIYNSSFIISVENEPFVYNKIKLPNYKVFDEKRYFDEGNSFTIINFNGVRIAPLICEDMWHSSLVNDLCKNNIDLILWSSASPGYIGRHYERLDMMKVRARDNNVNIAFCNLIGGNDELVYSGDSCIISNEGKVLNKCFKYKENSCQYIINSNIRKSMDRMVPINRDFEPALYKVNEYNNEILGYLDILHEFNINNLFENENKFADILGLLKLGLKDYVYKNGFKKCIIGLSGGIDSALVTYLAWKALGKDNVKCIYMPTEFNSEESYNECVRLTNILNLELEVIDIGIFLDPYIKTFDVDIDNFGIPFENVQARIRGNILMYHSNKDNSLLLTTGNKSELSLGYATLYGDMCGGLGVIGDLYKHIDIKGLIHYINGYEGIEVFKWREPSAELRHNQKDTDSLPDYEIVDKVLYSYLELNMDKEEICKSINTDDVEKVLKLLHRSEYKRRQYPPILRVSSSSFNSDRRYPITYKY